MIQGRLGRRMCVWGLMLGLMFFGQVFARAAQQEIQYTTDAAGNACIVQMNASGTQIEIPEWVDGHRVTALADGLLEGRRDITWVRVPESVECIPPRCFSGCVRLNEVILPEGLQEIGEEAFSLCRLLTKIELPRYVRRIGAGAFADTALRRIELPEGLVELGAGAFDGCGALEEIVLRRRLRQIDEQALDGCSARIRVEYGSDAENFLNAQGLAYEYAFRETRGWVYQCDAQGVTVLGRREGGECMALPHSLGGAKVWALGAGAFQAEEALREVRLSDGLKSIGDWAFSYCPRLEQVILPDGLEEIGADAFRECDTLKRVEIPASVVRLGDRAFEGCEELVLCVYRGSEAERYALACGLTVEILDEAE